MSGRKHSDETRATIARARQNKKWIYHPGEKIQKAVAVTELPSYLEAGWLLGRLKYRPQAAIAKQEPDFMDGY